MILIDDRDDGAFYFSSERVAKNDQLHQRKHHRSHHQRGAAEKFPHVAFDQRIDAEEFHARVTEFSIEFLIHGSAIKTLSNSSRFNRLRFSNRR